MNLANQPARTVSKESQLYSKRVKLTQRQMGEISGKVDKHGHELSKTLGYYTNAKSALTALIKYTVMQSTAKTLLELREDIRRIEQAVSASFDWEAVTKPTAAVGD